MWKTPWADSTSSSDDRGFTCQLLFIILLRFVVYSTEFNLSYVKYFPTAVLRREEYRELTLRELSHNVKVAASRKLLNLHLR